jgi:hypothetical protein
MAWRIDCSVNICLTPISAPAFHTDPAQAASTGFETKRL